ncbi:MAG: hypothetical protein H7281_00510 [Bacteriovorax sp.]|nr:hypothetical protein [Bacteriovorax sp.]
MKSNFKSLICCYLILMSPTLLAREVVLIENLASPSEGELLKSILIKKFHLPQELITLRSTRFACEAKSEAIIHLCLEANGELLIKKMNQYVVRNSLGVFLNQTQVQGEVE